MEFNIEHHHTVGSTNDRARERAEAGAPEGTVVLSDIQTSGRGRKGDHWFSSDGGLWFTLVLRPDVPVQTTLILPLLLGFSVHRAMLRYDIRTLIKLPNDVMVQGKKICGILCENRVKGSGVRYVVAGVGVNVMNDPPSMGISLKQLIERGEADQDQAEPGDVLQAILEEFDREYDQFKRSSYYFGDGYQDLE